MAEKPEDTAAAVVVPTLTKTDARELKSLVSRDTKILLEELEFRYESYRKDIMQNNRIKQEAISKERAARDAADQKAASKAMSKIQKRVETLNEAIMATLESLEADGWRTAGYDNYISNKSQWTVQLPKPSRLIPPERDDSDLEARYQEAQQAAHDAMEELEASYREARRVTTGREADILRELTLQAVTTDTAREFILEMPTSQDLLPAPAGVEALPAPVGGVAND